MGYILIVSSYEKSHNNKLKPIYGSMLPNLTLALIYKKVKNAEAKKGALYILRETDLHFLVI